MDNNKYLFLIVGASGSGKSTLAEKLLGASPDFIEPISDICEADDFWYLIGQGEYAFNPKLLPRAHDWCQRWAKSLMEKGNNLIVSNTNIKPSDRKAYFNMADEYGYKVVFIHLKTQFKSIHNVPDEAVKRMRENFIEPTSEELNLIVKSDEMTDELAELLKEVGVDYGY